MFSMSSIQSARRHLYFRWIGAPLLVSGVFLFLRHAFVVFDLLNLAKQLVILGSCILSLASFGINHDTAIAYALRARGEGVLLSNHPVLEQELKEDLDRDKAETMSLNAYPFLSYALPFFTLALQGYMWF